MHRRRTRLHVEELEARLPPANDFFLVPGNVGEDVAVTFSWLRREAVFANEFGVFVVDDADGTLNGLRPEDPGYALAAFSSGEVVLASGTGPGDRRTLTFTGGERLAFWMVQNNNSNAVRTSNPNNTLGTGPIAFFSADGANPDGFDHILSTLRADGGLRLLFEDLTFGGDRDFDDAIIGVGTATGKPPGLAGQTVATSFFLEARNGVFANEVGLFQVENDFSVAGLLPGAAGYAQAALNSPTRQVIFAAGASAGTQTDLTLPSARKFGFYFIQNGTTATFLASNPGNGPGGPLAFFTFPDANPDGLDHFDWLGENILGIEDLTGGGDRDFDDLVFRMVFGVPEGVPLDDGAAPTITARLNQDTFDPARAAPPQDTRNDNITADPSITGTVLDMNRITVFRASVDTANPQANILDTLQPDGTFLLDRARLEQIRGTTLVDGVHTLRLQAADEFGNTTAVFSLQFALDTRATATLELDAAFDTGVQGEFRTDAAAVRLVGTTEAGATVRLVRNVGGVVSEVATVAADGNGDFAFDGLPLDVGPNAYKVFATDAAGNVGESGATLARNQAPVVDQSLGLVQVAQNAAPSVFDLGQVFDDPDGAVFARFDTVLGSYLVQLFPTRAPQHVANFFNYVDDDDYDGSIFHRSAANFVIQGGGFGFVNGGNPNLVDRPTDPPVPNEPGLPNSLGTLSLAKTANNPDSGTNEFFFSLGDNVANLDNQNGGFTVFGQVVGNGQQVVNAIAAVPRFALGQFDSIPLRNFNGSSLQDADGNNFVLIDEVARVPDPLTYSATSNDNPNLVAVTFNGSQATFTYAPGMTGTANLVLRATDPDGSFTEDMVVVQVV